MGIGFCVRLRFFRHEYLSTPFPRTQYFFGQLIAVVFAFFLQKATIIVLIRKSFSWQTNPLACLAYDHMPKLFY